MLIFFKDFEKMSFLQNMKNPIRLESLDVLRGFDMFWIIGGEWIFGNLHGIFQNPVTDFINTQLTHVRWEGFRFWDVIMPLFLLIVGTAMPFSFAKRLDNGQQKYINNHAMVILK